MGESPHGLIAPDEAMRIATGGMLPAGADSVVMLEHADPLDDTSIEVFALWPGQNIIAAGEDFENGALIAGAGRRLRPQDAGVFGLRPDPGTGSRGGHHLHGDEMFRPMPPRPAQIRDMNSYTLAGLAAQTGALPKALESSAMNSLRFTPPAAAPCNATWC
jgi:molybdopterin molybdotransferase